MHLVIQIPCFNEAVTIGHVIRDIPDEIEGITRISVLVVDDGSSDGSAKLALDAGADYVARHVGNRGLAAAFMTGLETAIELNADVIVNTDADGQYPGRFIAALVEPIVRGQADIAIGDRRPGSVPHFSYFKRLLQRLGACILSLLMGRRIPDPVSGFRAISRDVAERLTVTTNFSYTLETLIQAVQLKRTIRFVPIETVRTPRPSRLASSVAIFIFRSAVTILRVFVLYYPLRSFGALATLPLLFGLALIVRFVLLFAGGDGAGHVQSLVIGSLSVSVAFLMAAIGIVAESQRVNRQLLQGILHLSRRSALGSSAAPVIADSVLAETEPALWR